MISSRSPFGAVKIGGMRDHRHRLRPCVAVLAHLHGSLFLLTGKVGDEQDVGTAVHLVFLGIHLHRYGGVASAGILVQTDPVVGHSHIFIAHEVGVGALRAGGAVVGAVPRIVDVGRMVNAMTVAVVDRDLIVGDAV